MGMGHVPKILEKRNSLYLSVIFISAILKLLSHIKKLCWFQYIFKRIVIKHKIASQFHIFI